jgi:phosphohistidine phosphatase
MLFLVHHADAVDPSLDPQRPLTERGQGHAHRLATHAAERGVKPAVIWHSGKLRARQTAEHFWRACNPLAEFSAARNLQPGDPPQWAVDAVTGETRDVMLVGHMPHIARLLALLTETAPTAPFPLHGLVVLQEGATGWTEVWREL